MSASVEKPLPIPRSRKPQTVETITSTHHPIQAFLENDERWKLLGESAKGISLRRLILKTAKEVFSLTPGELLQKAKELDEEIPHSSYLQEQAETSSTLIEMHLALTEIFNSQSILDPQQFERVTPRILQINYAGRLMGRKLELTPGFGWNPAIGFGLVTTEAQTAIDLCSEAIRDVRPPNI